MPISMKIRTRIEKPKILVIDDEVQLAELLRAVLESAGLDVSVVYDAADAPERIQSFRPDIILSDVNMPEMRGDELLAILRESHIDIPVILLTGIDRTHISIHPDDRNPYLILYKPIPHEVLIRCVENALQFLEQKMINLELAQELSSYLPKSTPENSDSLIENALHRINDRRSA